MDELTIVDDIIPSTEAVINMLLHLAEVGCVGLDCHTHTYTHTHSLTHSHHTHTHTHTHTYSLTHSHHTHTHTHTYSLTHTRTQVESAISSLCSHTTMLTTSSSPSSQHLLPSTKTLGAEFNKLAATTQAVLRSCSLESVQEMMAMVQRLAQDTGRGVKSLLTLLKGQVVQQIFRPTCTWHMCGFSLFPSAT